MNKERIDNAIKNTNIAKDMFIKKCDNCIELQKRIDKAIEWVNEHIETYTQNEISIIDWNTTSDPRQLKKILRGEDNDNNNYKY